MIGYCFNPACNKELRYLRQGSVYQWETGVGRMFHSEFFWLCLDCSSQFELIFDAGGLPLLAPCGSKGDPRQRSSRIRRVLRGVLQEDFDDHRQPVAIEPTKIYCGVSP